MTIENKYTLKILWILTIISTIISWILFSYLNFFNKNIECINCDFDRKINYFNILTQIPVFVFLLSLLLSITLSIMAIIFYYKKDENEKAKKYLKISWYLLLYTFLIFIYVFYY